MKIKNHIYFAIIALSLGVTNGNLCKADDPTPVDTTFVVNIEAPLRKNDSFEQKITFPKALIAKAIEEGSFFVCATSVQDSKEPQWSSLPQPNAEELAEWDEKVGRPGVAAIYTIGLMFEKNGKVSGEAALTHKSLLESKTPLMQQHPLSLFAGVEFVRSEYGSGPRLSIIGIEKYKELNGEDAEEKLKKMPKVVAHKKEGKSLKENVLSCFLFDN